MGVHTSTEFEKKTFIRWVACELYCAVVIACYPELNALKPGLLSFIFYILSFSYAAPVNLTAPEPMYMADLTTCDDEK